MLGVTLVCYANLCWLFLLGLPWAASNNKTEQRWFTSVRIFIMYSKWQVWGQVIPELTERTGSDRKGSVSTPWDALGLSPRVTRWSLKCYATRSEVMASQAGSKGEGGKGAIPPAILFLLLWKRRSLSRCPLSLTGQTGTHTLVQHNRGDDWDYLASLNHAPQDVKMSLFSKSSAAHLLPTKYSSVCKEDGEVAEGRASATEL